jgi:hypothetical protein
MTRPEYVEHHAKDYGFPNPIEEPPIEQTPPVEQTPPADQGPNEYPPALPGGGELPDGNGNGVPGEYGDGHDLDGNGIPDEIGINPDNQQPGYPGKLPDGNGNGIPGEYGDGPDLDGNGVPDEIGINPDMLQDNYYNEYVGGELLDNPIESVALNPQPLPPVDPDQFEDTFDQFDDMVFF